MLQKILFISSICILYILTIGTIGGLLLSSHFVGAPTWAKQPQAIPAKQQMITLIPPQAISAKPVRIVLPSSSIDLQIIDGEYNDTAGSWTLSDTNAHFATIGALANDTAGTTFIYGHGTDEVFGTIGTNHPEPGSTAIIYGENGKTFTYSLQEVRDFKPSDTSIFNDMHSGDPKLIIQTCTGVFSEWRTMFIYNFKGVS